MKRFNIFQHSHGALRSLLLDTSMLIQFTDFKIPGQVQKCFDQVSELILFSQRLAEEESLFIIPAIEQFHGKTNSVFTSGDQHRYTAATVLIRRINTYENGTVNGNRKSLAGCMLAGSFRRFAEQVLLSLKLQIETYNPLLWAYYTDQELKDLLGRIEGRQTMEEWLGQSMLMIKEMDDEEIVQWLMTAQESLPEPVFEELTGKISNRLPLMRWQHIRDIMNEELLVA